jgi:Xaa-Pro dipeptidase
LDNLTHSPGPRNHKIGTIDSLGPVGSIRKVHRLKSNRDHLFESLSPASDLPFARSEYRSRLTKLREAMASSGIDVLYLSSPESIYYMTGYRAEWYQAQSPKSWLPMSGTAVSAREGRLIHFDTVEEKAMAICETVVDDIRVHPEETGISMVDWVVRELKEERWLPGTVGLELWSYRPNRVVSERFQAALEAQGCDVVDGTSLVRDLRSVKSSKELEYVKKAARIAGVGMGAATENMRPGMTELEVYGIIISEMAKAGGENPGIPIPVISGKRSAMGHALASRKRIARGDIVNIDVSGVYNRYHANLARTFSMGKADEDVASMVKLSAGGFDRIREIIEPNMSVSGFVSEMNAYYTHAGMIRDRWWYGGYELGIAFPPDWVGQFVYDYDVDNRGKRFVPGTVVNFESNFWLPRAEGVSILIDTLLFENRKASVLGRKHAGLIVL